ncbi:hypothetical protein LTR84_012185 [Exophiala bonariae]|uniref:Altered inheritance of mitochondria protein 32 n=1 Tax=Exophiala bonariae TaxID=1690606 RepID=A0AAV9NFT7_9EURO|nr:hypothetical protein LTR84_012185 [Exophiala bonariae]
MNKISKRCLATSALGKRSRNVTLATPPPPFPVIPTCPSPTCQCSPTPADLDIDRTRDLNGSMSPYAQHLLISTGRKDWTSRIEDERDTAPWGRFTAEMKAILGRGGEFHDPYNNILLSTSSFTPWAQPELQQQHNPSSSRRATQPPPDPDRGPEPQIDALLFPAFKHLRGLTTSPTLLQTLTRAYLLPTTLHPIHAPETLSTSALRSKTRDASLASTLPIGVADITTPTILICSHGQRDSRCGVLGPLLQREFATYIDRRHREIPSGLAAVAETGVFTASASEATATGGSGGGGGGGAPNTDSKSRSPVPINVGTVSHVGGHKWAGNVIVYIPPNAVVVNADAGAGADVTPQQQPHPLVGKGIWYGRVEPRHVQGIVEETVLRGRVIKELFRGGVDRAGKVIRL